MNRVIKQVIYFFPSWCNSDTEWTFSSRTFYLDKVFIWRNRTEKKGSSTKTKFKTQPVKVSQQSSVRDVFDIRSQEIVPNHHFFLPTFITNIGGWDTIIYYLIMDNLAKPNRLLSSLVWNLAVIVPMEEPDWVGTATRFQ